MKILDIALKDLIRSMRSMFAIGMMIGAPLLLTALIYFAFGGKGGGTADMPTVKVGVLNTDVLPANAPITTSIGQSISDMFHDPSVMGWLSAVDFSDEAAARRAVDNQEVTAVVIVPQAFTQDFLKGETTSKVLIVQDPTLSIGPQVAANMVQSLLDGVAGAGVAVETIIERQQAGGQSVDPGGISALLAKYQEWYISFQRALFHDPEIAALVLAAPAAPGKSGENAIQQVMALAMAGQMVFFAFFTGGNSMMSLLNEDEEGTLARLFTTPTPRSYILLGKFLAVFLTTLLQGLVLLLCGRLAFGVRWGMPLSTALALVGQVVAAGGLGVLLISLVRSSRQGGPVLGGGLTILGMLGGLFFANIPNMPPIFDTVAKFTPQGWVMGAWKLVLAGQPASAVLLPVAVACALGIGMFILGALVFRRRFA